MRGGEDGEPPSPLARGRNGLKLQDEKSLDSKNLNFI